jgi:hypothetical protein
MLAARVLLVLALKRAPLAQQGEAENDDEQTSPAVQIALPSRH